MTTRILVLHGYSADNAGDGLLVHETLALVRTALGDDTDVTLLASRPESFDSLGVRVLPTAPTKRGWDPRTRRVLRCIDDYDIAVAVGGGYLRWATPVEALKTILVHGPQLRAAARASVPTIYLPQSIGPARFGTRRVVRRMLRRLDSVLVRDDRTVAEVGGPTVERRPDLATAAVPDGRTPGRAPDPIPVLSIRAVRGKINPAIYRLAEQMSPFDGYVQSTVGGNDDRGAMATLTTRSIVPRDALVRPAAPRVIVAVRLHAALMALAAGHYVVHLAYERKGFGAFDDLGLSQWVHRVNHFDVSTVAVQAAELLRSSEVRADYDARIDRSAVKMESSRNEIIERIRRMESAHASR